MYGPIVPELFESEKIVVRDVTGENEQLIVSYDNSGFYCDHLITCVTYYENVECTTVQTHFEGYDRISPPYLFIKLNYNGVIGEFSARLGSLEYILLREHCKVRIPIHILSKFEPYPSAASTSPPPPTNGTANSKKPKPSTNSASTEGAPTASSAS